MVRTRRHRGLFGVGVLLGTGHGAFEHPPGAMKAQPAQPLGPSAPRRGHEAGGAFGCAVGRWDGQDRHQPWPRFDVPTHRLSHGPCSIPGPGVPVMLPTWWDPRGVFLPCSPGNPPMGQAPWVPEATVMGFFPSSQLLARLALQAPAPAWVFGDVLGYWGCLLDPDPLVLWGGDAAAVGRGWFPQRCLGWPPAWRCPRCFAVPPLPGLWVPELRWRVVGAEPAGDRPDPLQYLPEAAPFPPLPPRSSPLAGHLRKPRPTAGLMATRLQDAPARIGDTSWGRADTAIPVLQ